MPGEAPRPLRGAWWALLLLALLAGPLLAWAGGMGGATGLSLVLSLATGCLALLERQRPGARARVALALVLAAAVPVHYGAVAVAIRCLARPLADVALASADAQLLGGIWPQGQLAIALDRSPWLGPATPLGRVGTEVLQVAYVSYYVWGYGLLFLLLARLRGGGHPAWSAAQAYLVAWVGAFLVNFGLYVIVPAMGPWWAHPEWFTHDVSGLLLTAPIRSLIAAGQVTPDCFPSGHTALSWIAALAALRLAPRYGRVATVAAALITLATVSLRYHYAVDVLAAVPLLLLGLWAGGFLARREGRGAGAGQDPGLPASPPAS